MPAIESFNHYKETSKAGKPKIIIGIKIDKENVVF